MYVFDMGFLLFHFFFDYATKRMKKQGFAWGLMKRGIF